MEIQIRFASFIKFLCRPLPANLRNKDNNLTLHFFETRTSSNKSLNFHVWGKFRCGNRLHKAAVNPYSQDIKITLVKSDFIEKLQNGFYLFSFSFPVFFFFWLLEDNENKSFHS